MNYMRKKTLILIFSLLMFICGIKPVNAATISKGEVTRDSNITTIPIMITIPSDENISEMKFVCETDNTEVKCEIKQSSKYNTTITHTFVDGLLKPLAEKYFPSNLGITEVAIITLTNTSDKELDVKVKLKESSYYTLVTENEGDEPNKENIKFTFDEFTTKVQKKMSSNSKASSIKFSQGRMTPAFNPDVLEYTVYGIQDTINTIKGSYECLDSNTCTDNGWSGGKSISGNNITLNQGENTVSIELISEDNSNKTTYTFKIIRGETNFNSSKLSSLSFGEYDLSPSFNPNTLEYFVSVPNKVNNLANIIDLKTEDELANATKENYNNLVVGENVVKIIVDNQSGDESTTYLIKVTRLSLEGISVTAYKNGFITVLDSESNKITFSETDFSNQYPDEYKKIKDGTYKFDENGFRINEVKPDVTTTTESTKKVTKKVKKNNILKLIIIIIVGLLIIVLAGIFIFKKSPDKKNKMEDEVVNEDETNDISEINTNNEENSQENEDTKDIGEALEDMLMTKQYDLDELTKEDDE